MSDLSNCVAIGGELGTSASKFCCDDTMVIFSSVVGDALSERMEKSWRMMNRSADTRWIKNLAIFDEARNAWRYIGAMTRSSLSGIPIRSAIAVRIRCGICVAQVSVTRPDT